MDTSYWNNDKVAYVVRLKRRKNVGDILPQVGCGNRSDQRGTGRCGRIAGQVKTPVLLDPPH